MNSEMEVWQDQGRGGRTDVGREKESYIEVSTNDNETRPPCLGINITGELEARKGED